jgi:hypothetical protein
VSIILIINVLSVYSQYLSPELIAKAAPFSTIVAPEATMLIDSALKMNNSSIPPEYNCLADAPKNITDLTSGVRVLTYQFDRNNQIGLSLLGFAGVNLGSHERAIVVEYCQTGDKYCNDKNIEYCIGARMCMKINIINHNAKVETPQQVAASVTFGYVNVTYEIITVGITGSGVADLVRQGTMTESTYTDFLTKIAGIIIDIYKPNSQYIISPRPSFNNLTQILSNNNK